MRIPPLPRLPDQTNCTISMHQDTVALDHHTLFRLALDTIIGEMAQDQARVTDTPHSLKYTHVVVVQDHLPHSALVTWCFLATTKEEVPVITMIIARPVVPDHLKENIVVTN